VPESRSGVKLSSNHGFLSRPSSDNSRAAIALFDTIPEPSGLVLAVVGSVAIVVLRTGRSVL
jgi:hypothetical protein